MAKYLRISSYIRKSYTTLQLIPSEFPYKWGKFRFLLCQCHRWCGRRFWTLPGPPLVRWRWAGSSWRACGRAPAAGCRPWAGAPPRTRPARTSPRPAAPAPTARWTAPGPENIIKESVHVIRFYLTTVRIGFSKNRYTVLYYSILYDIWCKTKIILKRSSSQMKLP